MAAREEEHVAPSWRPLPCLQGDTPVASVISRSVGSHSHSVLLAGTGWWCSGLFLSVPGDIQGPGHLFCRVPCLPILWLLCISYLWKTQKMSMSSWDWVVHAGLPRLCEWMLQGMAANTYDHKHCLIPSATFMCLTDVCVSSDQTNSCANNKMNFRAILLRAIESLVETLNDCKGLHWLKKAII